MFHELIQTAKAGRLDKNSYASVYENITDTIRKNGESCCFIVIDGDFMIRVSTGWKTGKCFHFDLNCDKLDDTISTF